MRRTTKTITLSLPLEIANRLDEEAARQGMSRSDFVREAVIRYVEECDWRQLLRYEERRVGERGIGLGDAPRLVEEYRAEVGTSGK